MVQNWRVVEFRPGIERHGRELLPQGKESSTRQLDLFHTLGPDVFMPVLA